MMGLHRKEDPGKPRLANLDIKPGEEDRRARAALSIVVDLDDVLFPWYDRAHAACVAAGITNGVEPKTWQPYEEYGCSNEQWWAALRIATHSGDLYEGSPFPGAVHGLWRLESAGHFIHLVTARGTHRSIDSETRELIQMFTSHWLSEWHVPYDSLTFSKDKTVVPADVSIDDNIENYDALVAAGHGPFLLDRPWNQAPDPKAAMPRRRVDSFADFANIILGGPADV